MPAPEIKPTHKVVTAYYDTPSLLARAFAGQLVPQNPTDEAAEKLLERIQSEHESKN